MNKVAQKKCNSFIIIFRRLYFVSKKLISSLLIASFMLMALMTKFAANLQVQDQKLPISPKPAPVIHYFWLCKIWLEVRQKSVLMALICFFILLFVFFFVLYISFSGLNECKTCSKVCSPRALTA